MAGSSRHIYGAWQDGGAGFIYTSGLAGGGCLGAEWRETRADWVFRAPGSGKAATVALWVRYLYRSTGSVIQMWVNTGSTGLQRTGWPRPETRAAYINTGIQYAIHCT